MQLTRIHLAYWQARHAPAWGRSLTDGAPDVHACINAAAGLQGAHREAGNMLALLRSATLHGTARESLQRMAGGSATHGRTSRRAAFARRWLARIEREQGARDGVDFSDDEISRYETHEILTPADMRMLQAAHEEQQTKPERTSWFHRWQNLPRSRPPGW